MSTTTVPYWPPGWSYFAVYGPMIVGLGFSFLLLGIVLASRYFLRFQEDRLQIKLLFICLLTTADTTLLWAQMFKIFDRPGDFLWTLDIQTGHIGWGRAITSSICTFIVQGYMIHIFFTFALALRAGDDSKMVRSLIWSFRILLCCLVVLGMVTSWIAPIYARDIASENTAAVNDKKHKLLTLFWNLQYSSQFSVDFILTVIFSIYLHCVRTGFKTTNSIINSLVIILLRNGFLVTSLQLASLLLYTLTKSYWILLPGAVSSKLYVLTALSLVTKPRAVQQRSLEEGLRPPQGITRPLSEAEFISSSKLLRSTTCQVCRSRSIGSSGQVQRKYENASPRLNLSFMEFISHHDNNEFPLEETIPVTVEDFKDILPNPVSDYPTGRLSEEKDII
ncbi:uncharacterized protein IL334_001102 [Kwoniella shivajii]|uniref:Integral membrane protein n=1 Tax=Kwoniella shivajii TaxID=564305 RepID=A0ABZ1CR62_9TREE|nr:hypothetical protein IL334_001102 [Kwoniella shivajii]